MLCGYLKQTCKSITVEELIKILQLCKNQQAVVKLSETTNFFIHFDQEGQFIDFTKSPCAQQYGHTNGQNCVSCSRYNKVEKCCGCDGKGCLNAESIVDTEKLDELRISSAPVQESSKTQAPTTLIQTAEVKNSELTVDKYDLSNYSINGSEMEKRTPRIKLTKENEPAKYITEHEAGRLMANGIQDAVDKAILNTLNRMITGIKGDK